VRNGPNISSASAFSEYLKSSASSRWEPSPRNGGRGCLRILSVSDDAGLGESRRLLLEGAGYMAAAVDSNSALSVPFVRAFDAAIICQSVPREHAARLDERLRRYNPAIRILLISLLETHPGICYDGICDSLGGPTTLLRAIEEMLRKSRRDAPAIWPMG
jgi:hypothetical protein